MQPQPWHNGEFVKNDCNCRSEYQFITMYPENILGINMMLLHKKICRPNKTPFFNLLAEKKYTIQAFTYIWQTYARALATIQTNSLRSWHVTGKHFYDLRRLKWSLTVSRINRFRSYELLLLALQTLQTASTVKTDKDSYERLV